MILIIDNYDSFTHNLFQYLSELYSGSIKVVRNDKITISEVKQLNPKYIVISPGPGKPKDAGISVPLVREFTGKIPILGVCLGHQAIGVAFGGRIKQALRIVHGKKEMIQLDGKGLFRSLPSSDSFTRYHSLAVDETSIPEELEVTAMSEDGTVMGLRHRKYIIEGVQFHPESIASESGKRILKNFLTYRREPFLIRENLKSILSGKDMTMEEAESFMEEVTEGNLTPSQIAGFLVALNGKGICSKEIAGCAKVLRNKKLTVDTHLEVTDTCGTGGDGLGTFNISSFAALVASACGVPVAKHGNRSVSSKCGSADFYAALGIDIDLDPIDASNSLENSGFAFLFAPRYHHAMKHCAVPRKELGIKTIMNLLGPLSNPAGASKQLIGVFSKDYIRPMAEAAKLVGIGRALIVHGWDGMDEISVSTSTSMAELKEDGTVAEYNFNPIEIGLSCFPREKLKGGNAEKNVKLARELLLGRGEPALREAVLLNTGGSLYIAGTADSIKEGYLIAMDALDSGRVERKLEEIIDFGKSLRREKAS